MVTIYHNPKCGTSRNTLALIRNAGIEPVVVEYLKTPPTKSELQTLLAQIGKPVREIMRGQKVQYAELQLDDPKWTERAADRLHGAAPNLNQSTNRTNALGDAFVSPIRRGVDILDAPQRGAFSKEDGEAVIDALGQNSILTKALCSALNGHG